MRPFMDDLFEIVKGTDSLIALSDKHGVVLDLCGDSEIAMNAALVNFTVGVEMAESSIGTNSIGTTLALGKAIQVIGAEHYCAAWHHSHCASAPIVSPFTNEVIGVITLIGYVHSAHPHSLGLVKTASETISKLIEQQGIKKEKYMINNYFMTAMDSISDGIMVINRQEEIIQLNSEARSLLKVPSLQSATIKFSDVKHFHTLQEFLEGNINKTDNILHGEFSPQDDKHKISFTSKRITIGTEHIGNIIIFKKKLLQTAQKLSAKYSFSSLIGADPSFTHAVNRARKAARTDKSVLIFGESGTGKELIAQAIHNESNRKDKPFLPINCASLPKELMASELFGYTEGAFTNASKGGKKGKFEAANGGTIFLDEIGDMPLDLQSYLLRIIEEREVTPIGSNRPKQVDVRIIAATNKDLSNLVKENKFRLDLFYRINVLSINIPPLCKRKQDIELFINHYLPSKNFQEDVLTYFYEYEWPGNIREIKNVLEQIEVFCDGSTVTKEFLPEYLEAGVKKEDEKTSLYHTIVGETKKDTIVTALKTSQNVAEASEKMGVSTSTLYRWLINTM
ncbi:sigma-54-dependent Fis family transcriptional regulator [Thalassobacillus sp. C254]|uniref:sigma-54-dependent Fis family transcriptional regulator n=1 Tax=Thalassobacillus sp. C254 TaxID=1225341 RepID=UPI0006D17FC6|nr:sigma 54-interacting transcriptional regulator [Thalassobacillus sp. C254]